ncbi:hypothetical protein BREVNS_0640 [Brevinematales bacterium NS]|nr:hypothetical protein BREVNS_0640 [Brevinematales bacterium NS]
MVRGYVPLLRFFCFQGLICLFSKNRIIYYDKVFLYYFLFFYEFFETFAHSCIGLNLLSLGKFL